jgi:hypothetical protein
MHPTTFVQQELARQRSAETARRARLHGWVRHAQSRRRLVPINR